MKILWLTDSPLTCTGYSTISWNILNRLSEQGHECYCIGHNYIGQTIPKGLKLEDGTEFKFTILGGSTQPYAQDILTKYIAKYKPDVFGVLLDTFMLFPWFLNLDFAPAKTIFYYPSDGGGGLPMNCENILKKVNCAVAMAKFGQRQVKEIHDLNTNYIPHAVDTNIYYPLPDDDKKKLRQKWGLQDKFVVGVVARNQGRKMLDRTIKTFAMFAKDNPDAILFMHTDPTDVAAPFNIQALIARYKLQNRVVFTGMTFFHGFDYKQMNELYNVMDVFFLSTSGEGFGVPIIEAMACEVPVAATDYTTTPELLVEDGECGISIKLSSELTGSWNVERGIMDDDDAVKVLQTLKDDPELRKKFGKEGRVKVNKYYNWAKVGKDWNKLLTNLIK